MIQSVYFEYSYLVIEIMFKLILSLILSFLMIGDACLITNCPRGGKRSKLSLADAPIKLCVTCGPGHSGQCFGPDICCGPFGCLIGTPDSMKCQREGFFHEKEPCIAGSSPCRKNTGRCATDGICCNQDSCITDKSCRTLPEDKPLDLYNLIGFNDLVGINNNDN